MPAFWWIVALIALACFTTLRGETSSGTVGGNEGHGCSVTVRVRVTGTTCNPNTGAITVNNSYRRTKGAGGAGEVGVGYRVFNENGTMASNTNVASVNAIGGGTVSGTASFTTAVDGAGWSTIRLYRTSSVNSGVVVYADPVIIMFNPGPAPDKRVTIKIPINKTAFPITYKLMQDGVEIGSVTLNPGQGLLQTFTVPSTSQVNVLTETSGIGFDGSAWVVNEELVTTQAVGDPITPTVNTTPPETDIPLPTLPESENPATNPIDNPATNSTANTNKYKPIWTPQAEQTPGEQTNLLTIEAYREGVEKLMTATVPTYTEGEDIPPDAVDTAVESFEGNIMASAAPSFFTGSPGGSSVISADLPSFSVLGKTWPAHTFSYDLSQHSAIISWFRAICSVCLWVGYFILCVNTARGAGADK